MFERVRVRCPIPRNITDLLVSNVIFSYGDTNSEISPILGLEIGLRPKTYAYRPIDNLRNR